MVPQAQERDRGPKQDQPARFPTATLKVPAGPSLGAVSLRCQARAGPVWSSEGLGPWQPSEELKGGRAPLGNAVRAGLLPSAVGEGRRTADGPHCAGSARDPSPGRAGRERGSGGAQVAGRSSHPRPARRSLGPLSGLGRRRRKRCPHSTSGRRGAKLLAAAGVGAAGVGAAGGGQRPGRSALPGAPHGLGLLT